MRSSIALCAVLSLATLALAGCVAPDATEPPAAVATAAPQRVGPTPGNGLAVQAARAEETHECPQAETQREERRELGRVVVTVRGCFLASQNMAPEPVRRGPRVAFDVPEGTSGLRVQVHLHGAEPLKVGLEGPEGKRWRAEHAGDATHDSLVVMEFAAPAAGPYEARFALDGLAAQRAWTAVVVMAA